MENINVHIIKRRLLPGQNPLKSESPFDERSGFFGVVIEVQPKNNTVSIRSDTGRVFVGIRVASPQWVTMPTGDSQVKNKEKLTGQRYLPPVNTFVYCLMPTGEPSSAIVLCSVFAYRDAGHAELRDAPAGKEEDFQNIDERIDSGGWKFTHDLRTGTRKIQNAPVDGNETISLEVNQKEKGKSKITLQFFDNTIEFDEEKQGLKQTINGDIDLAVQGKATIAVNGNADIKGDNVTVEASTSLTLKTGDAAPWVVNSLSVDPMTGVPHGGKATGILKLKGA
ncbi:hypothetical protein FACS1894151_09600 [Spirochaetia bacterium]|nr:hypothetical protein FACS1894151_09600 [Spirochaetia bacterium]